MFRKVVKASRVGLENFLVSGGCRAVSVGGILRSVIIEGLCNAIQIKLTTASVDVAILSWS